jgi:hypothetical protein
MVELHLLVKRKSRVIKFHFYLKNYINTSHINLIFKSTIEFIRLTLSLTNSMMDLKLGCIEMHVSGIDVYVLFLFLLHIFKSSSRQHQQKIE